MKLLLIAIGASAAVGFFIGYFSCVYIATSIVRGG